MSSIRVQVTTPVPNTAHSAATLVIKCPHAAVALAYFGFVLTPLCVGLYFVSWMPLFLHPYYTGPAASAWLKVYGYSSAILFALGILSAPSALLAFFPSSLTRASLRRCVRGSAPPSRCFALDPSSASEVHLHDGSRGRLRRSPPRARRAWPPPLCLWPRPVRAARRARTPSTRREP